MALVVWSYPGENHFNALESDPVLLDTLADLRTPVFGVKPFSPEEPYRVFPAANAQRLNHAADWVHRRLRLKPVSQTPKALPNYQQLVQEAVTELSKGQLYQKLVLSRFEDRSWEMKSYNWVDELRQAYPNAFICLLSDDEFGTWVMASPELFLKREKDRLQSYALAGTQIAERTQLGKKERHEQGFVTEYISDVFAQNGLKAKVHDESLKSSGNLKHLLNRIEAEVTKPLDVDTLLKELHPTPAVGGLPKRAAINYLQKKEGYDRLLYAGFVGLWQSARQFSFYVNLRSCQLFSDSVRFFAGAGITQNSDPESEWAETAAKMNVLRSVLQN